MPVEGVRVAGLDELRRDFRKVDKALAKDLGQAGKKAADIVARAARSKVPVDSGRTARSMRAKVSRGGGAVVFGTAKVTWAGWLDFGGRRPQDKIGRLVLKDGRYVYPSLAENRERVVKEYAELVDDILKGADL